MPPPGEGGRLRVHRATAVPAEIEEAIARDFELVPTAPGADGIVATPAVPVDASYLDGAGAQLRIVANYAVGTDNVDLEHARTIGVVVTNTPDVLTQATAELTIGLMLALLRRICEGDRMIRRRDRWQAAPEFMLGVALAGRDVLVVGRGRIGRRVAELVEAHGAHASFAGRDDDLVTQLSHADVVTLHCPLTSETRHLIDARALAAMKPSAVLVNTARGPGGDVARGDPLRRRARRLRAGAARVRGAARARQRRPHASHRERDARDPPRDGNALRGSTSSGPARGADALEHRVASGDARVRGRVDDRRAEARARAATAPRRGRAMARVRLASGTGSSFRRGG